MARVSSLGRIANPVKVATFALVSLVIVVPLAIGGVHLFTEAAAAMLAATALFAVAVDSARRGSRVRLDGFAFLLLGVVVISLLQVVPLPGFLVRLFASENARIYGDTAAFLGGDAAERVAFPISLDVPATLTALLSFIAVGCVYVVATNLSRRSEDVAERLLRAVALSGAFVLAVGIVQTALGMDAIFGLYHPRSSGDSTFLVSTFVNPNHLASFLTLTGLVALGISQNSDQPRGTVLYGLIFLGCIVGAELTLSRGGMVAALGGTLVFALVSIRNQRAGMRTAVARLWLFSALVIVTTVAVFGYDVVAEQLAKMPSLGDAGQDVKLATMSRMRDLILDFPVAGVGPGALGDVFARYNDVNPGVTVSFVENLPLQLAVNWGLPVAVVIVVLSFVTLGPPMLRGSGQSIMLGAAVGLYTVALHNMVDFSLSILGVAIPAAVAAGVITGLDVRDSRDSTRAVKLRSVRRVFTYGASIASIVAAPLIALWVSGHDRAADDEILRARFDEATDRIQEDQVDTTVLSPTDPEVVSVVMRHPADGHVLFLEGMVQYRLERFEEAKRWFEEALSRSPRAYGPMDMLARTQLHLGHRDAAISLYKDLLEAYWDRFPQIVPQILTVDRPIDVLDQVVPADEEQTVRLAKWLEARGDQALAEQMLRTRLLREPSLYLPRLELGLLYAMAGAVEASDAQATQLIARHPDKPAGYLLQGIIAERAGDARTAYHMYSEAHQLDATKADSLLGMGRTLVDLKEWDKLKEVVGELRPLVAGNKLSLAKLHHILSQMAEEQLEPDVSVHEMEMAVQLDPRNIGFLVRLGDLHAKTEDLQSAESYFRRALALDPTNASIKTRLEKIEQAQVNATKGVF